MENKLDGRQVSGYRNFRLTDTHTKLDEGVYMNLHKNLHVSEVFVFFYLVTKIALPLMLSAP